MQKKCEGGEGSEGSYDGVFLKKLFTTLLSATPPFSVAAPLAPLAHCLSQLTERLEVPPELVKISFHCFDAVTGCATVDFDARAAPSWRICHEVPIGIL